MKQIIRMGLLSSLWLSAPAFAFNPVNGFYVGIMAEASRGPSGEPTYFVEDQTVFQGTVAYSQLSGGAGAMFGYRYNHFRTEGEFLFNRISTGPLTVGTCTIQSPNVQTPTGVCPQVEYDHFMDKALGYSGSSTATYLIANVFWDFYKEEPSSNVSPYVGIGVGESWIKNSSNYINTITLNSHGNSIETSGIVYQGILGISYYMDDYAWATMDYRYLNSERSAKYHEEAHVGIPGKNYVLNTINFTVNFAFDKGGIS